MVHSIDGLNVGVVDAAIHGSNVGQVHVGTAGHAEQHQGAVVAADEARALKLGNEGRHAEVILETAMLMVEEHFLVDDLDAQVDDVVGVLSLVCAVWGRYASPRSRRTWKLV